MTDPFDIVMDLRDTILRDLFDIVMDLAALSHLTGFEVTTSPRYVDANLRIARLIGQMDALGLERRDTMQDAMMREMQTGQR